MAYANKVAEFLDSLYAIDFELPGGLVVNTAGFHAVAAALRNRQIKVTGLDLKPGTKFAYSPDTNTIYYPLGQRPNLTEIWPAAALVHEAVHAMNDLYKRATISKIDNEAAGWIAQFVYLLQANAIQEQTGGATYTYLCGAPAFDRVYKAAAALASQICEGGTGFAFVNFNNAELGELRKALGAHTDLYQGVVGQLSTDNLGLPVRGKIKELDSTKIKLTVGGKDVEYKVTGFTKYYNSADEEISRTDPKFAVDKECLVACEDPRNANHATYLEAL